MSKYKIVNLLDKLFVNICIFLIVFAWINFYLRDLWLSFILSLIFSFAIVFVLFYFINRKQTKNLNSIKYNEEMNKNFLAFKLMSQTKKLELIKEILSIDNICELKKNYISFEENNKKHICFISTNSNEFSFENLCEILTNFNTENFDQIDIIVANKKADLNTDIFKNKAINIIDKKQLYDNYFVKYQKFPNTENLKPNLNKLKWKDIAKNIFLPHKAKAYFFSGLILILSSLILPYHAYYIVIGSMLILFSIICKILPKFKD